MVALAGAFVDTGTLVRCCTRVECEFIQQVDKLRVLPPDESVVPVVVSEWARQAAG
jgi:hypothetical protein